MKKAFAVLLLFFVFESNGQQIKTDQPSAAKPVLNETLKNELEAIFKKDQEGRLMVDSIQKKFGFDSKELLQLMESIEEKDQDNRQKIAEIINRYGWPGKSMVGSKANQAVFLVVQHAEIDMQKKYLPLLRESVEKGESNGANLAYLDDRILMREGKPQRYGTQLVSDQTTGKWKLYAIEDEINVDERRQKIGLTPLAEYAKRFGIEYKKP